MAPPSVKEYKIVVLGAGGVGKSALTVQFVLSQFVEAYDPTIEDSYRKQVDVDGKPVMLEIIDTAGSDQFTAVRNLYMKSGHGFVLVYSILSLASFNDLPALRKEVLAAKDTTKVPMILVGNKRDLDDDRAVTKEQGAALATSWGNVDFIESSARKKSDVEDIFLTLVRQIHAQALAAPAPAAAAAPKRFCVLL